MVRELPVMRLGDWKDLHESGRLALGKGEGER
jgi:hypothetical protein